MKFEVYDRCVVAFIQKRRYDVHDNTFLVDEAVRAIHERDGWRIDFSSHMVNSWLPWEAIDQTHYKTLKEAKAAILAYSHEVKP